MKYKENITIFGEGNQRTGSSKETLHVTANVTENYRNISFSHHRVVLLYFFCPIIRFHKIASQKTNLWNFFPTWQKFMGKEHTFLSMRHWRTWHCQPSPCLSSLQHSELVGLWMKNLSMAVAWEGPCFWKSCMCANKHGSVGESPMHSGVGRHIMVTVRRFNSWGTDWVAILVWLPLVSSLKSFW